jgi:hypothetical protein
MTGFRNIALAPAGIAGTLLTGIARCKADVLPEFGQSGGRRNHSRADEGQSG